MVGVCTWVAFGVHVGRASVSVSVFHAKYVGRAHECNTDKVRSTDTASSVGPVSLYVSRVTSTTLVVVFVGRRRRPSRVPAASTASRRRHAPVTGRQAVPLARGGALRRRLYARLAARPRRRLATVARP